MYKAKLIDKIDQGKGFISGQRIGVYRGDDLIGTFDRNYSAYGVESFAPFERSGQWYALYSPDYTALRVLKINEDSIEDIGGEEPCGFGFCPVEVYIPRYRWWHIKPVPQDKLSVYPEQNRERLSKSRYEKIYDTQEMFNDNDGPDDEYDLEKGTFYENFVFLSGCHWGDDHYFKIQIRDISNAHLGKILSNDEWDYYELPPKLKLKEAINLSAFEQFDKNDQTDFNITIAVQKTVVSRKGKVYDPDKETVQ